MEFPTLEEQRAIVDILDKTSNVIIMRNNEISALDDLIKARFIRLKIILRFTPIKSVVCLVNFHLLIGS